MGPLAPGVRGGVEREDVRVLRAGSSGAHGLFRVSRSGHQRPFLRSGRGAGLGQALLGRRAVGEHGQARLAVRHARPARRVGPPRRRGSRRLLGVGAFTLRDLLCGPEITDDVRVHPARCISSMSVLT
jgi:hypothetical protein